MSPDHGDLRPRPGVPEPNRSVEPGGSDSPPIRAEGHRAYLVGVSLENGQRLPLILGFPKLDRPVVAGRGDGATVRAERDGCDRASVPTEDPVDQMAVTRVPDFHRVGRD